MARSAAPADDVARALVLDELLDLSLYVELRKTTRGPLARMLDELIPIETKHVAFWKRFFQSDLDRLDWSRRLKLAILTMTCRLFGDRAIQLVLEGIEIYGVRKYLALWESHQHDPLGRAAQEVLRDELKHEDRIVSESIDRRIDPEGVRNVFLGFNDGLVEILGAVSGFFGAFHDATSILLAASTVAVAGSFSMAAGAFVAASSETEVRRIEIGKRAFLREPAPTVQPGTPLRSALVVGVSYLLGALVPVLPVLLGARTITMSFLAGAVVTILVSAVLAFLTGMELRRRLLSNVTILAAAVAITYTIGLAAKHVLGPAAP
jgi:VIT1/CCC1 family predicted Fe2+/Mn2+ transporter